MPLAAQPRNAILSQLDAAFDALGAGTLFDQDFLHQSFSFVAGGRTYIVQVQGEGTVAYSHIVLRIKRIPL